MPALSAQLRSQKTGPLVIAVEPYLNISEPNRISWNLGRFNKLTNVFQLAKQTTNIHQPDQNRSLNFKLKGWDWLKGRANSLNRSWGHSDRAAAWMQWDSQSYTDLGVCLELSGLFPKSSAMIQASVSHCSKYTWKSPWKLEQLPNLVGGWFYFICIYFYLFTFFFKDKSILEWLCNVDYCYVLQFVETIKQKKRKSPNQSHPGSVPRRAARQ